MTSHTDDEKDRLFARIPPIEWDWDSQHSTACDFCYRDIWEPCMADPQNSALTLRLVTDGLQICEGCWEKPEVKAEFTLDELRQAAGEGEKAA